MLWFIVALPFAERETKSAGFDAVDKLIKIARDKMANSSTELSSDE